MKKLNSKGFGIVEGLLIIVIIGLIGGAGYYVYNAKKNTNESLDNTGNSEIIAQNEQKENGATDPTADWETYTNQNPKFSFKYPLGWDVVEENGLLSVRTSDYKLKTTEFCPELARGYEFSVSFDSEYGDKNIVSTILDKKHPLIKDAKPSELGSKTAVRYSSSPGECGWREATATYYNGYEYTVYSSLYQDLGEYEDEYDLVVKSFSFEQ